jgi:hypothetical protein
MKYPLCAAVMNQHLADRRGYPLSGPPGNLPTPQRYKQWLTGLIPTPSKTSTTLQPFRSGFRAMPE